MIKIRKSGERGFADFGWLKTYHSFSFGHYYDPEHMGFSTLRVINDDVVSPGKGFDTHGHKDMEIVTYIIEGTLAHKDSIGNIATIKSGEVQRMSAGTGIRHSEFNHSDSEPVRLLQIWVLPEKNNIEPGYEQKIFAREEKLNRLRLIVSPDNSEGSLKIHQDTLIYASVMDGSKKLNYQPEGKRNIWIQIARGVLAVNGKEFAMGDGIALSGEEIITLKSIGEAEFLLFDLP